MINIVIPMAGAGSRFANAGYIDPKPLIDVFGKPMIEVVINNIRPDQPHRFIFICQKEHLEKYALEERLNRLVPGCSVIAIEGLTEGAACTVLKARELINSSEPLMIANSDQYIGVDINHYLAEMDYRGLDGLIMTMWADDPKWSFVELNTENHVVRVVEKMVISNDATVGIYNFKRGSDFVSAAETMIHRKETVNGEYYVAPTYDYVVEQGAKVGIYNIGKDGDGMYGLGIPSDLQHFLKIAPEKGLVL